MSTNRTEAPPTLPAHELREIAVLAECDPRTVNKALLGLPVSPLTLKRIRRALARRAEGGGR